MPKAKRGRPTKYRPEYCQTVVEHMAQGASLTSFAAEIGVARRTVSEWMNSHPEFSEAVEAAKARCAAWWESVARKCALEGGGNAALVIFGLKNMAMDEWRDRREIEQRGLAGPRIPFTGMSDEELEAIAAGGGNGAVSPKAGPRRLS